MAESASNGQAFIGYEYKDVYASGEMRAVYENGYPNFGWEAEDNGLRFRRNRKIRNKAELTRLQRQFESGALEIERLERSKISAASAVAMSVGVVGTAFLAGSVFALIYGGMAALMVILAAPGFAGWVLPYFVYKKGVEKRTAKVAPLIDQKYDEICDVCQRANGLLA